MYPSTWVTLQLVEQEPGRIIKVRTSQMQPVDAPYTTTSPMDADTAGETDDEDADHAPALDQSQADRLPVQPPQRSQPTPRQHSRSTSKAPTQAPPRSKGARKVAPKPKPRVRSHARHAGAAAAAHSTHAASPSRKVIQTNNCARPGCLSRHRNGFSHCVKHGGRTLAEFQGQRPRGRAPAAATATATAPLQPKVYRIEKFLKVQSGRVLVKWEGCGLEEATWEPGKTIREDIGCVMPTLAGPRCRSCCSSPPCFQSNRILAAPLLSAPAFNGTFIEFA